MNALKTLTPDTRRMVEEKLADGWPFKEIEATTGVSYYLLRKHWPGKAWTHQQITAHAIAARQAGRRRRS